MVNILPPEVVGAMSPYPTVVNVTTEKYKQSIQFQPSKYLYIIVPKPITEDVNVSSLTYCLSFRNEIIILMKLIVL
jgi:hypothetical protein